MSKIAIAVKESHLQDWDIIRLELYGFRAGIGIKLSHFSIAFFFELVFLSFETILTYYIRNL